MPPDPVVLNYSRSSPPVWRRIVKWTVRVILIAAMLLGLGWGAHRAWQARERYRYQQNWLAATAALTQITLPPDTILIDPASGPVTYMKPFKTSNSHGTWRTLTIPTNPARETQLRLMGRFSSLSAHLLASDMQTGHGKAFVSARVDVHEIVNGPSVMWIPVNDETMQPGTFPFYQFTISGYLTGLRILPSEGRNLPTLLVGQIDPGGSSWTLPLRVDGKPEWVRFDHSGPTWATVTASFGQLTQQGSQWELKY
jgi:hypothetical protein